MKKYHIADALTALEVLCAIILTGLTVFSRTGTNANLALWLFVIGELCDAFDGICARRWHYPDDGKFRWWRKFNSEIDQVSDILLAIACAAFIIWRVDAQPTVIGPFVFACDWLPTITIGPFICDWPPVTVIGTVAAFCLAIQIIYMLLLLGQRHLVLADRLVLIRRFVYILAIVWAIVTLILATDWPEQLKELASNCGAAVGIVLIVIKWNRLTQNKTPL